MYVSIGPKTFMCNKCQREYQATERSWSFNGIYYCSPCINEHTWKALQAEAESQVERRKLKEDLRKIEAFFEMDYIHKTMKLREWKLDQAPYMKARIIVKNLRRVYETKAKRKLTARLLENGGGSRADRLQRLSA